MTLQDFFISGLPTANVETKPRSLTASDRSENEKSRGKIDAKPAIAPAKTPTPSSKRTKIFHKEFLYIKKREFHYF
jgi:hypothetical protein